MSISDREPASARASITDAVLEIWAERGARNRIKIAGNSMLPLIVDGDGVLVEHGATEIRRGDIIVFRYGNDLAAHRVLSIHRGDDGPTYVTKGDNAPRSDPPLSAGEIVGRVLAIERGGRHLPLDTPAWQALGWLIAAGTLAWARLYSWSRVLKQRVWGPQPNRVTAFLRQSALALFPLLLNGAQAVLGRWEEGVRSASKE